MVIVMDTDTIPQTNATTGTITITKTSTSPFFNHRRDPPHCLTLGPAIFLVCVGYESVELVSQSSLSLWCLRNAIFQEKTGRPPSPAWSFARVEWWSLVVAGWRLGSVSADRPQSFLEPASDILELHNNISNEKDRCWRPKNGFSKSEWKPQDDLSCTRVHRTCVHRSE
jgi:hypothetical protein